MEYFIAFFLIFLGFIVFIKNSLYSFAAYSVAFLLVSALAVPFAVMGAILYFTN